MRGTCGPRKTLPGVPAAFFGTPEPTVYLIVHNTEPLSQTTLFFSSDIAMALKQMIYYSCGPRQGALCTYKPLAEVYGMN